MNVLHEPAHGTLPDALGTARLDRRDMLRRSAMGLAVPAALATAGLTRDQAVAQSASESGPGSLQTTREELRMGGGLSQTRLERMHEVMADHVESGFVPGLVTLVSRRGDTHVDVIGTTAFDSRDPMRRDTIFRIASVTKPIVAAAAMILVEEGTLRLDDPVDPLLPELANRQVLRTIESPLDDTVPANRPITLRDLLTFRLGYGAIFAAPGQYPIQAALEEAGFAAGPGLPTVPPDELMERYGNLPLLHQPGEKWLYNTGSDILGVLIARATDMTLGEFLQERIFDPLGMKDTAFSVPASKRDRLPAAYWTNFESGEFEVFDPTQESRWASPPAFESGASGLVSTVDDLFAFAQMMLGNGKFGNERLLSRPAVALMTTDQITPEQKAASASDFFPGFWDGNGWGFGVAINTRRDNLATTPGRYGWDGGYGTSWYVDPAEELIGILLTQRVWDAAGPLPTFDFWTSAYQAIDD
jgi:CubicO group peptidase (beta-lactamase class C family)